jgi:hypothetical protein
MCLTRAYDGFIFTETVPIVVVFTKYDLLVRMKRDELEEDNINLGPWDLNKRSKDEAQKVSDTCVKSVESAFRRLGLKEQMLRHAIISSTFSHPYSVRY